MLRIESAKKNSRVTISTANSVITLAFPKTSPSNMEGAVKTAPSIAILILITIYDVNRHPGNYRY